MEKIDQLTVSQGEVLTLKSELPPNNITFFTNNNRIENPILELKGNGDIFVKGKLVENDKEVVDAMREFLGHQGFLK